MKQRRNGPQPADTSHLIGQRFGELVVIGTSTFRQSRHSHVEVRCDCGVTRPARVSGLTRDKIATCGGPAHVAIARPPVTYSASQISDLMKANAAAVEARFRKPRIERAFKTYAAMAVGTQLVKIGKAFDIRERLRDLQLACPLPLIVFASTSRDIEHELHKRLAMHRAHGEWFRHSDEVDAVIRLEMTADDINGIDAISERLTVLGTKRKCHHCGELGHMAKTCVRQQRAAFPKNPGPPSSSHNAANESALTAQKDERKWDS